MFRGAIDGTDVQRGLAEGRSRQEWGPAFEADAVAIPTPVEYVENHLRGYSTQDAMYAGTARHGMSKPDTDTVFQNAGRPMTVHQATMALARGATFQPIPGELTDPYDAIVHESSLKPAYYEMEKALKYGYPPFFQTVNLLKNGSIDPDTATKWLLYGGYAPDAVATVVSKVSGGKAPATDTHVKSATTSAITAIRKAYVGGALTHEQAAEHLTTLGVAAPTQTQLFAVWDVQRTVELTPPPA
jgi:hypothetical protein